jgi:cation:H+ antiporter
LAYLELFGGLVYLLMGGDLLVRGAVALARRANISPMLVGVTIVALGTSAPELFVALEATLTGHPGIALGNVVGSNIANVLLVAGSLAIIFPILSEDGDTRADTIAMLAASLLLVVLCFGAGISQLEGVLLLVGLVLFLGYKARHVGRIEKREGRLDFVPGLPGKGWMIALFIVVGSVWLPLGAHLLIRAASTIARDLGVSEAVVGLTVVAVGTSLPELATVFVATARRHTDVALGNVIGSNVLNILAILGAAVVIPWKALPVPEQFLRLDLPVMVVSALLITVFTLRRRPIGRMMGILMLVAYVAYVAVLYGAA